MQNLYRLWHNKKEGLILDIGLKRDKANYIHLKTTEETIPIQIPVDKCEK